jgi:hypothetical protein
MALVQEVQYLVTFLKIDAAWQMNGLFRGSPRWYFAMGFDF